jgi:hypothetical protein
LTPPRGKTNPTMKNGSEIVALSEPHLEKHSKFTPRTVDAILAAIADGLNISQACVAVGISRACYNKWKGQFPAFLEGVEEAREKSRQKALAGIKAAGDRGDWRALEVWLKMSFHPDYRDKGAQVQVNTGVQIVCDEQTRQRLIELNRKLLKGSNEIKQLEDTPNAGLAELTGEENNAL